MQTVLDSGLLWWISVIDIPVMSGLFWFILRTRREADIAMREINDSMATFKIEVARHYAPTAEMKDLEHRIVSHLLRIEKKLDTTALKTEALQTFHQQREI